MYPVGRSTQCYFNAKRWDSMFEARKPSRLHLSTFFLEFAAFQLVSSPRPQKKRSIWTERDAISRRYYQSQSKHKNLILRSLLNISIPWNYSIRYKKRECWKWVVRAELSVSLYVLPNSFALSPHRIFKEHAVVEEPYKVWHFWFIHIPSNSHSVLIL